jgi:hydroxymethylbilane synthase
MVRDRLDGDRGRRDRHRKTTGDMVQDRALAEIGGKALWTKELDRALLADEIDCAVHSMKDVETIRPQAIIIAAMLPRADVRDRLVGADSIAALPQGAVVGTSSPRRAAQAVPVAAGCAGRCSAAMSIRGWPSWRPVRSTRRCSPPPGLDRLGRADIGTAIATDVMLPAPAQGAVGIEARTDDAQVRGWLAAIDDGATHRCVLIERALLAALAADCHSPVAALACEESGRVTIRAELLTEDGSEHVAGTRSGAVGDFGVAEALAADLLSRASPAVRRLFAA